MPHALHRRAALLALAAVLATAGCRQGAQGFGGARSAGTDVARQAADDFTGSIAQRFTDVHRTPRFAAARGKLAKHALTPSRVERDTSIWTGREADGTRVLTLAGYPSAGRYVFDPAPDWPLPRALGQSRHAIRLKPLGDGAFEWRTDVQQAMGAVPAEAIDGALGGFFRAVEGLSEPALKADSRLAFPRTAAAWGRLFSVDTVRGVPHPAGGRSVTVVIRLHPRRLEGEFPAFARYLKKYVEPARYSWTLAEPGGTKWLQATADDNRLLLRFRVHDGALAPWDGAPRPMPASLVLEGEMFARVMIFEVGASRLRAEATRVRTGREDGWRFRFRDEPEWHFPLATKHLIRESLRRPFEGEGTQVFLSLREDGGTTHLSRGVRTVVKESAIVRWLGALGWTAANDFAGASETEENRFIAEGFRAMQADARELLRGAALLGQ